MVKVIQFLIELELRKHPEVSLRMESAMEQMINQINELNLHLLQLKIDNSKNMETDLWTIQCYNC
jgi:hydroxypyruvate isomerase